MLFTSANNSAWSAHQTEDMKYELHFAKFSTGEGEVEFVNDDTEFCVGTNYLSGRPEEGQDVHAFDVAIAGGGSGYSVNDVITLAACNVVDGSGNRCAGSGVKLKVTSVNSGAVAVSYTHLTLPTIYSV